MRMQHYAIFLQGFNYKIEYRKSENHGNADCMSRLPLNSQIDLEAIDVFFMDLLDTLPVTADDVQNVY